MSGQPCPDSQAPPPCPYCSSSVELVTGKEIYPHRSDLRSKHFWRCRGCGAYVGCHTGTTRPLGRLADAELRTWKSKAHAAFDPLWRSGRMGRKQAYAWLAVGLGIHVTEAHIGMFDVELCRRTVEECRKNGRADA